MQTNWKPDGKFFSASRCIVCTFCGKRHLLPSKVPLARRSMGVSDCNACNGAASGRPTTSMLAAKSGNESDVPGKKNQQNGAIRCKSGAKPVLGTPRYGTILQRVAKSRCLSTVLSRAWSTFDAIPTSGPCSARTGLRGRRFCAVVNVRSWRPKQPSRHVSLTARWGRRTDPLRGRAPAVEVEIRSRSSRLH
jgi:hypothetical protein